MMETESAARSLPATGPMNIKVRSEHYDNMWDIPFSPPDIASEPPKLPIPQSKYHLFISDVESKDLITVHESSVKLGDFSSPVRSDGNIKKLNLSQLITYNNLNSALGIQSKVHASLDPNTKEFINPFGGIKDKEEILAFSKTQKDHVSKSVPVSPNESPVTSPKLNRHFSTLYLPTVSNSNTSPKTTEISPLAAIQNPQKSAKWYNFYTTELTPGFTPEFQMTQAHSEKSSRQPQTRRKRCLISNADINAFAPTSM